MLISHMSSSSYYFSTSSMPAAASAPDLTTAVSKAAPNIAVSWLMSAVSPAAYIAAAAAGSAASAASEECVLSHESSSSSGSGHCFLPTACMIPQLQIAQLRYPEHSHQSRFPAVFRIHIEFNSMLPTLLPGSAPSGGITNIAFSCRAPLATATSARPFPTNNLAGWACQDSCQC